jgi:hypothetical protein
MRSTEWRLCHAAWQFGGPGGAAIGELAVRRSRTHMSASSENKAAWLQVLRTVQTGSVEEVLRLKCGACGSSLQIVCTPGKRTSLAIRCAACSSAIALDGESEAPPWVESLGGTITTRPGA